MIEEVRAALVNEFARQVHHAAGVVDFDRLAAVAVAVLDPKAAPAPRRLWDIFAEADKEQDQ